MYQYGGLNIGSFIIITLSLLTVVISVIYMFKNFIVLNNECIDLNLLYKCLNSMSICKFYSKDLSIRIEGKFLLVKCKDFLYKIKLKNVKGIKSKCKQYCMLINNGTHIFVKIVE